MVKIYTKTGDKGTTSLIGGDRVYKDDLRVEVYGSLDELNSLIGVIIAKVKSEKLKVKNKLLVIEDELLQIQKDLFEIEANIANKKGKYNVEMIKYFNKRVNDFEILIDKLMFFLPALKNFILPGGDLIASYLHLGRTISRRVERLTVKLKRLENIEKENLIYLNRLSDLFFTLARFVNFNKKIKENIWGK